MKILGTETHPTCVAHKPESQNYKVVPVDSISRLLTNSNTNPFCGDILITQTQKLAQVKNISSH